MEGEEAGSVAHKSFPHPTLPQERRDHPPTSFLLVLHGLALGTPVASALWFHIARQSPSRFPHVLWGSAGSLLHEITVSISMVLCFLSLLGRLRVDHLLKSPVDRINLTLNPQFPTGIFQLPFPSCLQHFTYPSRQYSCKTVSSQFCCLYLLEVWL